MVRMNERIKSEILEAWIKDIPFDDVSWTSLCRIAQSMGHDKNIALELFPQKVPSALSDLSASFDQKMCDQLNDLDITSISIRDRIRNATMTRISIMAEHKESYRKIAVYWANPLRGFAAKKIIWNTADHIWNWAGDKSTDYNYYTKRGLLSGVLATTYIFWLQDNTENAYKTEDFLQRRIENVVKIGQFINSTKNKIRERSQRN